LPDQSPCVCNIQELGAERKERIAAGEPFHNPNLTLPVTMVGDRMLAFQALRLLMRIDRELLEARAQWNQDWFRRLMRIRRRVVRRLSRRWEKVTPPPSIRVEMLRRRYHPNLASYLYETRP
jgi:hypothetical protein